MALSEQAGRCGEAALLNGAACDCLLFFLWVALLMLPERGWRKIGFTLGTT